MLFLITMPKRPRSHILEDQSRTRLHAAFEGAGWTVEDLSKDYGEDLLVRIFERESATPLGFFVQAKATDNLKPVDGRHGRHAVVTVESGHVRHWLQFAYPVILTLWEAVNDTTYWVCVQDALGTRAKKDSQFLRKERIRLRVPLFNVLHDDGIKRIMGITKLRHRRLEGEREVIGILSERLAELGVVVEEVDAVSGAVTFRHAQDHMEILAFGRTAKFLHLLSQRLGLSQQEAMSRAMRVLAEEIDSGIFVAPTWEEFDAQNEREEAEEPISNDD